MNTICVRSNKKSIIVGLLAKCDRRRSGYKLIIHTCYFDNNAAKALIKSIRSVINISEFSLYIDNNEASKFYFELKELAQHFRGIKTSIKVVCEGSLFHSKAYCVTSVEDGEIISGSLVLGSGNLTNLGIDSQMGNVESFLGSIDTNKIDEFLNQTYSLETVTISDFNPTRHNFPIRLIDAGCFIHFWAESVHNYLSVKYQLTEESKNRVKQGQPILVDRDFNIEQATISKPYLQMPDISKDISGWKKNYCIETHLGYWMPKSVYNMLINDANDDISKFRTQLTLFIKNNIDEAKKRIVSDYESLIAENIVEHYDKSQEDVFESRIYELMQNSEKLARIYYKYHVFDCPYTKEQEGYRNKMKDLFDEIKESIKSKKKKNIVMKKVEESIKECNLRLLETITIENKA
jgi:hypothetical protein